MDSDATHAKESKFNKMCKSKLDLAREKNSQRPVFIKGYCTTSFKRTTTPKFHSSGATVQFHLKSKLNSSARLNFFSSFGGGVKAAVDRYFLITLKGFAIFTANSCAGFSLFVKKRLQHRCFLVNIVKFLITDSSRTLYILFGSLFERELTTAPDQRLQIPKQLQEMFFKKAALKNFAIFTGKHMCLKANNFVKKRL